MATRMWGDADYGGDHFMSSTPTSLSCDSNDRPEPKDDMHLLFYKTSPQRGLLAWSTRNGVLAKHDAILVRHS